MLQRSRHLIGRLLCVAACTAFVQSAARAQSTSCSNLNPRDSSGALLPSEQWAPYAPATLSEMTGRAHGALVACYRLDGSTVSAATGLSGAFDAYVTRHVTTDNSDRKWLSTAALFRTQRAFSEPGKVRPVMVLNTPTAGIPARCGATTQAFRNEGILLDKIADFLDEGYHVLVPDYIGHGIAVQPDLSGLPNQVQHAFIEGKASGRAVLDAILAARALPQSPLTGAPLAMQGYSQGGAVTAWAADLAPSYAPQLSFAAIRAGGVPINLPATMESILEAYEGGSSEQGFLSLLMLALMNSTDPTTRMTRSELQSYILDPVEADKHLDAASTKCRPDHQLFLLFDRLNDNAVNIRALIAHPKVQRFLVSNSLDGKAHLHPLVSASGFASSREMARPAWPFTFYGSTGDDVAPRDYIYNLVVGRWSQSGGAVPTSGTDWAGYVTVPRARQVWLELSGQHGLDEQALYRNGNASTRYTPREWLADSVCNLSRVDSVDVHYDTPLCP